jgi:hypothetical protein
MAMTTANGGWVRSAMGAVICLFAACLPACAETLQKTAESAAPAVVEGAVEEAKQPDTRDDIAKVLADPEIQQAATTLASAIVAGALDGVTDDQRVEQMRALTDAMVRSMGASIAHSLRDDIGPQLSKSFAEAIDRSIEGAFDADTERRVEAMTLAVARGMVTGLGETLVDPSGNPAPAWARAFGPVARDVAQQAAFGLDDAVRHAQDNDGDDLAVLAALGTLSALTRALPFLIVASLAVWLLGCAVPVAWLALRLRHYKRESLAREDAALALARAIKAAEPHAWSNELREHLARETKGVAGAGELSRLLRDHAELQLKPRDRSPRSEPSADLR